MGRRLIVRLLLLLPVCFGWSVAAVPAQNRSTEPVIGLQEQRPSTYAITGADVWTEPGQRLDSATIIVRDGLIEQVGTDLAIPAAAQQIDANWKIRTARPATGTRASRPSGARWKAWPKPTMKSTGSLALSRGWWLLRVDKSRAPARSCCVATDGTTICS